MNLNDIKDYFKGFVSEPLTACTENKNILNTFSAPYGAKGLEHYIRDYAWDDDIAGKTKVYLIKDGNGQIVLYYSLRCGLVIDNSSYESLDEDKKGYVDWMTCSIMKNDSDQMSVSYEQCAQAYGYKEADRLYDIATNRAKSKNDKEIFQNIETTLNVEKSYSAIELQHFCKSANYPQQAFHGVPIGFGLFWEQIIPNNENIATLVGCEYLYLFAADKAQGKEPKKLVEHYKSAMKFSSVEGVKIVKPYYDVDCISLVQPLLQFEEHRKKAWEEYSDLLS